MKHVTLCCGRDIIRVRMVFNGLLFIWLVRTVKVIKPGLMYILHQL